MKAKLPLVLQQLICNFAIGRNGQDPFALIAMTVNKSWAYFVCRVLYRHYRIKNYVTFISFVKTVTSPHTILPYGLFIRSIDLTPVNKYGIDMRAHLLMRCCPNIVEMTLGHPTTLKPETIQGITKYNSKLHTLSMGGIDSYPFMLECDFSGLAKLQHVTLKTTPLLSSAFMTLPSLTLKSIRLVKMDSMKPEEFLLFCQTHKNLESIVIDNCRNLLIDDLGKTLANLMNSKYLVDLKTIELVGHQITNQLLSHFFNYVTVGTRLDTLTLVNTSITKEFMDPILSSGSCYYLHVNHLNLKDNRYLSQ